MRPAGSRLTRRQCERMTRRGWSTLSAGGRADLLRYYLSRAALSESETERADAAYLAERLSLMM